MRAFCSCATRDRLLRGLPCLLRRAAGSRQLCPTLACRPNILPNAERWMPDDHRELPVRGWRSLVLSDVQFWVPAVVLAFGLLVLRWIA
jgi:hypothetical protein